MPLFATDSLVSKTVAPCEPWAFAAPYEPGANIRNIKQDRQDWYRHVNTRWNFYTGLEASNPNQRVSKTDNPPKNLHAFCADYDVKIPMERILEVVKLMDIKPQWIETSLGYKARLIWILPRSILVDNYDYCVFLLQKAIKWLRLELLPGFDEGAFTDPTRLLCNGAEWRPTDAPKMSEVDLQAFVVEMGREFRFIPTGDGTEIPLDIVEKAIKDKFPTFSWPGDFAVESQGPSFWVEGSTSAMSAIVKKDGMFTFSDHADKPFYSWGDILGSDFVKDFTKTAIAVATKDIYWDQKNFWRKKNGYFANVGIGELQNYFKVQCRLSSKPGKDGQSQVDKALDHIYNANAITGAGPFLFRPCGVIEYMSRPVLNTYVARAVIPSSDTQKWGPDGNFPFLSFLFDNLFEPAIQKEYFLAWWKHFYVAAHTYTPMPGQNLYLMGGASVGKTMTNRAIIGRSVGGFVDASDFLIGGAQFNSENYDQPLWCIDDEAMGESAQAQARFHAIWKKTAANQQFKFHKKFEIPLTIEWMGRIVCTTNMDYVSSRMLGPMDNTSMDKTSIFKCVPESRVVFPNRYEMEKIISRELPYLLRWLLDWNPPDYVERDTRFGYRSFHESTLLDQALQGSKSTPFKELLIEALAFYFESDKQAVEWRGTVTQLLRMVQSNPQNDLIMKTLRLEQTSRYLEMIQREGILQTSVEPGAMKTRVWVFKRFGDKPTSPESQVNPSTETSNKFSK